MWKTLGTKPLTPEERRHIAEYLYGEREWGRCSGSPTRSRSARNASSGPENRIARDLPGTGSWLRSLGELNKFCL